MYGDFEEDPAADFLERERKELQGLEDDPVADFFARERQDFAEIENDKTHDAFDSETLSNAVNDFEIVDGKNNGYAILEPQAFAEPVPVNDCEKVIRWKQEFIKRIEEKDAQESLSIQAMRDEAAAALSEWLRRMDEQRSTIRSNNRKDESAFVEERDATSAGGEWERVCRLCDFSTSKSASSGPAVSGRRDISRMRSLLLQLKQTPPVHFGGPSGKKL